MWLLTNGVLIAAFVLFDRRVPVAPPAPGGRYRVFDPQHRTPLVSGWPAVGFLVLLVAGVFIDPMLARHAGVTGLPIRATFLITIAAVAFLTARPSIHHANRFTFAPVKEVGFLFAGIFLTMAPALEYLSANAGALGIGSPTRFYFGTGMLSAFLDNAPTYICFLQLALAGLAPPLALDPAGVAAFIATASGRSTLEAISLGAVFFGAMTYIGNGPNFMVKSIVDSAHASGQGGVRMPSFFGYFGLAALILLPVLALNWLLFIR
jgi:Na+/H+ antiporter NhaD/arsenite permease-like protein